jgi:hypothetical protein
MLKKLFSYDRGKQIFRLLPIENDKILIEERDRTIKEAFFSCLDLRTGKIIFSDLQFDEKYWIGIESIYKDVIFFHKFERPDLPNHKGIIAYDIKSQTTLWEKPYKFLFVSDDKVFMMSNESGITEFYLFDYLSGENETDINEFMNLNPKKEDYSDFIYSRKISKEDFLNTIHPEIRKEISGYLIKDYINLAEKDNISLCSFHYINDDGKFDNIFYAFDKNGTILLQETLNKGSEKLEPESFFIKGDLLFLLFGVSGFGVYQFI